MKKLIDELTSGGSLTRTQWAELIAGENDELREYAAEKAVAIRRSVYGNTVFTRYSHYSLKLFIKRN